MKKQKRLVTMIKTGLSLLILLSGPLCYSQTTTSNIRPVFTLNLFVDDSTHYEAPINSTLFIPKDGVLQVFPGENIFVEADVIKDSLINFKIVPQIINKANTLTVTFAQIHEDKKHKQMILSITNPFSRSLEYSAIINLMKQKRWIKTSVVPVLSGLVSYETWPDIITTIVLNDFHLKNEK